MAKYRVTAPDGTTYEVSAPDGASQEMVDGVLKGVIAQHKQRGAGGILDTLKSGYESLRQIGGAIDPMGEFVTSRMAGEKPRLESNAFLLRTAPGLIPNPWLSGGAAAIGETGAQEAEMFMGGRSDYDKTQIALAGAIPPAVAGATRLVRGIGRTATRMAPSLFERAQGQAAKAGGEMVEGLRPTVSPSQLAGAAAEQGTDIIPLTATQKVVNSVTLPAKSANPQMEAVRTTIENIKAAGGTGAMSLNDLEAIRQDIGPLVGRTGVAPKLKALYEGMIRDLEAAAATTSPGAAMARDAATAFKQEMGASKVAELISQASPIRTISGAAAPALNIGTFGNLVKKNHDSLVRNIGPDAMKVIDAFIYRFRGLPPDVAFNGWNRAILTLGGAGGGMAAGGAVGNLPGAMIGALTPEVLTNMALVGRNPPALQQFLTTVAEGTRAGVMAEP